MEFEGQKPTTYREGEMFYEPPRTIHVSTRNASSTEPATLVAFFVADAGQTLTEPVRQ
jgi:quercetin dioxygenase-like cupin family protein